VIRPLASETAAPKATDGARRSEILQIASRLFAASGYTRTSLKDVADACGILPGSLYHHFDSKQALATELLERYHAELDEIGQRWLDDPPLGPDAPTAQRVTALGVAIAECAARHGAALQLSAYEPHTGAGAELVGLARRESTAVTVAMRRLLDEAAHRGDLVERVDRGLFSEQLCETMLHVGLVLMHGDGPPRVTATLLCTLLLHGIAVRPPTDRVLNRSAAMGAASAAIAQWSAPARAGAVDEEADRRRAALRAVARAEFARRGYEATTIRDIAAAAGMGTGTVYRLVEGKEALLVSIMNAFYARLADGYTAVAAAPASAVAKLDALTWLNVNARERFSEEFEIQRAWFRSYPPETSMVSDSLRERSRIIRDIVGAGVDGGEIRADGGSLTVLSYCVRDLIWVPPSVVGRSTTRGVFAHARATVLRGALTPTAR
jgi:AcrR family transcriptional regulator